MGEVYRKLRITFKVQFTLQEIHQIQEGTLPEALHDIWVCFAFRKSIFTQRGTLAGAPHDINILGPRDFNDV